MRERKSRIVVDELACHHQVTRNRVRVCLVQAQQVAAYSGIELAGLDVLGQIRFVRTRLLPLRTVTFTSARREAALAATTAVHHRDGRHRRRHDCRANRDGDHRSSHPDPNRRRRRTHRPDCCWRHRPDCCWRHRLRGRIDVRRHSPTQSFLSHKPRKGTQYIGSPFGNGCSAVSYSPTPCRVQYHRRWRA